MQVAKTAVPIYTFYNIENTRDVSGDWGVSTKSSWRGSTDLQAAVSIGSIRYSYFFTSFVVFKSFHSKCI